MAENSKIEWTDHTFNPWIGCTKISVGPQGACEHCYAESWAKRTGNAALWAGSRRRTTSANWRQPLKWNAEAERAGVRPRVFCASLADVFDNDVPEAWRADLFSLIRQTPHLDWLLLTKRIGNAWRMTQRALWDIGMHPSMHHSMPGNVWLGATIATRSEMLRDGPKLRETPGARVYFWSVEPQLGEFGEIPRELMPDWIIIGGESGAGARPFVLGWGKEIVRQCHAAGVACFVKQVGARPVNREGERCPHVHDRKGGMMEEWPLELRVRQFPRSAQIGETDHRS